MTKKMNKRLGNFLAVTRDRKLIFFMEIPCTNEHNENKFTVLLSVGHALKDIYLK